MHVLQTLKTVSVSGAKKDVPYFKNYNSPQDL